MLGTDHIAMDLNAFQLPEEDEESFYSHFENDATPQEETNLETFQRENNEKSAVMTNDDVLGDSIPKSQEEHLQSVCYQMFASKLVGVHRNKSFPGSHPVSLSREKLQLLRQRYYCATWKADGTRYMLMITYDGCYLIDRNFRFRRVQMRFPCKIPSESGYALHHYTLLDGEMIIDRVDAQKQARRFLIYDLIAINNVSVIEWPFNERWKMIEKEVIEPRNAERRSIESTQKFYYRYDWEPFRVRRKEFWSLFAVTKVLKDFIPKLSHDSDGLIFQGWDDPYVPRTHEGLLKWKYPEMNSVDFLFEVEPDGTEFLCVTERQKKKRMDGNRVVFKDGSDPSSYSGKIIECSWNEEENVWVCMRVRVDKSTPNEFNTYRKVLKSIKDNITEDILLEEIREIICLPMYADRIKQDKKPVPRCKYATLPLLISAVLRVLLIVYGEWHDARMEVRYTDIDYHIFSDAASLMSSGQSPYGRTTYRYSPLLAFLLIPNAIFHHTWGKFIFSASDLLVGLFINIILKLRGVPENLCSYSAIIWFFNPFTFTIGTRGNCEPIVCAAILWIIICIMKGRVYQAAFWYGLIVHFRVYPIIYALPILLVLDPCYLPPNSKPVLVSWKSNKQNLTQSSNEIDIKKLCAVVTSMFTRARVLFGLISGSVFLSLTGLFFCLYGWEFLNEALLYHLTRTDPRHNFSIYFYHIYLKYEDGFSTLEKLVSFLPQFAVQLVLISRFALDLPFCFLVQTVAFVAFNKVITAQYFVWFFCLLPLTLPWSNMKLKWEGVLCILIWIGAQTHWLLWGYLLEFKGKNVFLQLWGAGLLFLAANAFVLVKIIRCHNYSPLFMTNAKKLN